MVKNLIISLAFRNIWRRKFRTTITIIAIMLTTALYSSIGTASTAIAISSIRAYTDYVGDFDILVTGTQKNAFFNASETVNIISDVEYVKVPSPRLIFGAYSLINNRIIRLIVIGINETLDSGIGYFEVIEGNLDLGENKCVVLSDVAAFGGINVGDNMTLYHLTLDNRVRISNVTVSGIVEQHGKLPIDMKAAVFVSIDTAQRFLNASGLANFVFVKLDESVIDPYDLENSVSRIVSIGEEIQKRLGFSYTVTLIKATILRSVNDAITFQKTLLGTFASTALLMAVILIVFTVTMNLHERIREIGVLRSLGMGKGKVFALFMTEALLLGLIGSIIGAIGGIFLSEYLFLEPLGIRQALKSHLPSLVIDPYSLVFSVLIGIVTTIIGGIYPALSATRIEPAEALSPAARRAREITSIEKKIDPERPIPELIWIGLSMFFAFSLFIVVLPLLSVYGTPASLFLALFVSLMVMLISVIVIFSGIFPSIIRGLKKALNIFNKIELSLANVNLLRRRRRTILAFFMIASAVSALLLMGFLTTTQEKSLTASIKLSSGADIVIYAREPIPINYTVNITSIEGVADVCPVTSPITVTAGDIVLWESAALHIYGLDPLGYVNSSYVSEFVSNPEQAFSKLNDNLTIIISEGVAQKLNVWTGDLIRIDFGKKTYLLKVVAVIPNAPGFTFTRFSNRVTGTDILVSITTYRNITGFPEFASKFFVKVKEGYDPVEIANNITSIVGEDYDVQVIAVQDYIDRASQGIEQLKTLLNTLLSFAIIIAVLGQMSSIVTSIREREWEIGVLRALGAGRFQVAAIFVCESIILSLLGYLAGFLGAFLIAYELTYSNNMMSEIVIPVQIPLDLSMYTFLLILVPTILLASIVAYMYTRKDVAETLKSAEIE